MISDLRFLRSLFLGIEISDIWVKSLILDSISPPHGKIHSSRQLPCYWDVSLRWDFRPFVVGTNTQISRHALAHVAPDGALYILIVCKQGMTIESSIIIIIK